MHKKVAVVILVLGIAILVGSYYLVLKKKSAQRLVFPDKTDSGSVLDWDIFSSELGFSLRYPADQIKITCLSTTLYIEGQKICDVLRFSETNIQIMDTFYPPMTDYMDIQIQDKTRPSDSLEDYITKILRLDVNEWSRGTIAGQKVLSKSGVFPKYRVEFLDRLAEEGPVFKSKQHVMLVDFSSKDKMIWATITINFPDANTSKIMKEVLASLNFSQELNNKELINSKLYWDHEFDVDQASNSKIYRNQEFGFQIKFPSHMNIQDFDKQHQSVPLYLKEQRFFSFSFRDSKLQEEQKNFYDRQNMFVGFQMLDQSPLKTIEEWACSPNSNCVTSYKTIGGVRAIVNTFERAEGVDAGNKERNIVFIKDGKLFQFYTGHNGIPQESLSILVSKTFYIDQIAETFKFTK